MSQHPHTTAAAGEERDGLLVARRRITAARARGAAPSDGGGTGRSDTND